MLLIINNTNCQEKGGEARMILCNGKVLDANYPETEIRDIRIDGHLIGENDPKREDTEIDVGGSYIFPGLIDYHAHVFHTGSETAICPDLLLATGVTTVCDGGTSGPSNADAFVRTVVRNSWIRVMFQVCLSPAGQAGYGEKENYAPALMEKNLPRFQELKECYGDRMTGLKIKFSEELIGSHGIGCLEKALETAHKAGLPLIVHVSNMPVPAEEIVKRLRTGDVFCHMYQGRGAYSILDGQGNVLEAVKKARERGVIFDACNGMGNFSFDVAKKAIAQGFYPDIISTDHTSLTFARKGYVPSLPHLMSKYLALGIPLEQVVRMVTETPARLLGMEGRLGTLQPGAYADITVCRLVDRDVEFLDCHGSRMLGKKLLIPQLVISNGRIVYRNDDI